MHRVVVDEENMMKSEIILALRHINEHMVSMYLDDKYLVTESLEVYDAGLLGALEQHGLLAVEHLADVVVDHDYNRRHRLRRRAPWPPPAGSRGMGLWEDGWC